MEIEEIKKLKKNLQRFYCEKCDFKCYMKCDWDRHILRPKHSGNAFGNDFDEKKLKKTYFCECGRKYTTTSGLWKHRKNCNSFACHEIEKQTQVQYNAKHPSTDNHDDSIKELNEKDLIVMLIKDNTDLRKMLVEQCKETSEFKNMVIDICRNGTTNSINNSNNITQTNSNNKSFNLQFFLNETCKDAMNITEFVDSIKLQLSDLEDVGELGYVKGISNIIVKNLNALDITQRPVHCADKKREVLYVKDDNKWEKEDDDNKRLRKMIKRVAFKNYKQVKEFKEKHPDCNKSESKYADKYNTIIVESMGGSGDNEKENEDKIIRNISKQVVIDKLSF